MKRAKLVMAAAVVAAVAGCAEMKEMMPGASDGWTVLFDGSSLGNFNKVGDANWRIQDGLAVSDKGVGFLVTKESYGDFEIKAEFYAESDTNSGIFIRCQDPVKLTSDVCYEVNIFDTRPKPEYGTGAIVDVAKVDPMPKAGGKWNTYHITAKGDHFVVVLNGVTTADAHNGKHKSGPIGLQHAAGAKDDTQPIKFKSVQIRRL